MNLEIGEHKGQKNSVNGVILKSLFVVNVLQEDHRQHCSCKIHSEDDRFSGIVEKFATSEQQKTFSRKNRIDQKT